MPTLNENVEIAIAELRLSRVANEALANVVSERLGQKATEAQVVIQQFISRPASINVFCDPIRGDDAADGSSPAKAKKSLDAISASMTGPSGVAVLLLEPTIVRLRTNPAGPLDIYGCQRSGNSFGWTFARRTIGFLGTAENSPIAGPLGESATTSGFFLKGPKFTTNFIDFLLPDQPAGQPFAEHINASASLISLSGCGISVAGANAGCLIGAAGGRATVNASLVLSAGAAGHVFQFVGAGQNPNARFEYDTNVTSA